MNNELYHHGIKGMKWGIRRFRNSDGSLTNAGKQRYGNQSPKKEPNKFLLKTSREYRIHNMSDDEIANRIARLSQEKKLRDLERDVRNERDKVAEEIGKKFAIAFVLGAGTALASVLINSKASKLQALMAATKDTDSELHRKAGVAYQTFTDAWNVSKAHLKPKTKN